jgi:hypothetical protein
MTTSRRAVLAGGGLLTSAALLRDIPIAAAQPVDAGGAPEPAVSALETAVEAYIYGYPLVTMEMTRRLITNAEKPEGLRAPMGQFANLREYPTAAFKAVTAPNADTLYSSAWLDLSQGPWILQVPDEHGRWRPGLTSLPIPARAPPEPAPANLRLSAPTGTANSLPEPKNFGRAPTCLDYRPHLLHRHARGLRGRTRDPGSVQACAAQRLRQAVHAAARKN